MKESNIRNFCIIAHIDHGKSTFADRLLELTGTVEKRKMKMQYLDSMELEREKGITIKLKVVRMNYEIKGELYQFNLIDTPGHVDFASEVSRSLSACEGAILLVDATQGIQAQTLNVLDKALKLGLKIIPVVNKIDMPTALSEDTALDITKTLGFEQKSISFVSAKTGFGVAEVLERVANEVPKPKGNYHKPFRRLVFDSFFDEHLGVVAVVKVVDGFLNQSAGVSFLSSGTNLSVVQLGCFIPKMERLKSLSCGEVGFIATGLKNIRDIVPGDTVYNTGEKVEPIIKQEPLKPVVFLGIYPSDSSKYLLLRTALERISLTDSAIVFEPEAAYSMGQGFRCGFLGLLHAEIITERIEREFGVEVITTTPTVTYRVVLSNGEEHLISSAQKFPDFSRISKILEPFMKVFIYTPESYMGQLLDLCSKRRGQFINSEFYEGNLARVKLIFSMPLSEIVTDFYDNLKSVSSGYASLDYESEGFKQVDAVKLDIYVAEEIVPTLSRIVFSGKAEELGRKVVGTLRDTLPRMQFPIKLQAAIGSKVIARETISAVRKDVTGYLYGGDITRKMKLLEKQKKGKKKLIRLGRVNLPKEAFWKVVKIS